MLLGKEEGNEERFGRKEWTRPFGRVHPDPDLLLPRRAGCQLSHYHVDCGDTGGVRSGILRPKSYHRLQLFYDESGRPDSNRGPPAPKA